MAALRSVLPNLDSPLLELIDSTPLPTELVLTTLVNELTAAPAEVWLVLDDYHLVDSSEVDQGLAVLIDHLPPHVHVVVSTRADPGLPLPRWRVRGQLVEIRAADLTAGDVEVLGEEPRGGSPPRSSLRSRSADGTT